MKVPAVDLRDLQRIALVVVDVQHGFEDEQHWGARNNSASEANIVALLAGWRA